jgi:hypothetical protein
MSTSLNETDVSENAREFGIAFPDTKEYRGRMRFLQDFCTRKNIFVYWVAKNGQVTQA